MKHATSRELYAYWDGLRGREPAPRRNAVEPADIRRILADTFILEVVDREQQLVRLAGTRMCAIYGREIKGTDFLSLWSKDDRQAMATLSAAVSLDGAGAVLTAELTTVRGQTVACEFLLLPLRHGSAATYDRVLGSCVALDRPYWLGSEAIARQTIASLRLIWPDEKPGFLLKGEARNETPPPPIPFPGPVKRRKPHLVLLDGGKA